MCAVIAVTIKLLWPVDSEPTYQGRALSYWLTEYSRSPYNPPGIGIAIRNIGTSGVPLLVKWINYEPSAWKTRMIGVLYKVPALRSRRVWDFVAYSEIRQGMAVAGFRV